MNALKITLITAGAVVALAAPAAQAHLERIAPAKAKIAQHHKVAPKQHKKGTGSSKASRTTTLYIYYPAPLAAPTSFDSSADDCANYMVCTDEQLCSFWATGCSVIVSSSTSVATPVDNAASIANAINCPGGGVWDEDYQYCV